MSWFSMLTRPARWGVRVRSALTSAAVVGVVLLFAAGAMLRLLNRDLVSAVDAAATARTADIATQLAHITPADLDAGDFVPDSRVAVVQLLGPTGTVMRSSNGDPTPLVSAPVMTDRAVGLRPDRHYDPDLRVAARVVAGPAGRVTVLAASSRQPVEDILAKIAVLLVVGGPVIVLVAAAATHALVGRSLRSVDAIRARVAAIEAANLSERVPVPAAHDEIADLAVTMNDMLARIEAGHAAQRRFVGDASHELRSPLATITAALELARDRPEILDHQLLSGTLLPEAARMEQLIADLLTLAAADEHGIELRSTEVDLDHLAETEAATLRLRGVAVSTDTRPSRIVGDSAKLARVIRNLVDNAATYAASRVIVATEVDAHHARLIVDDDGPGIRPEDRQRVFERFVRVEPDRARASGGSGLGLAIVAEIVHAHGGSVAISESPLGGTRVTVTLPVDSTA